jgi:hypothetical protein
MNVDKIDILCNQVIDVALVAKDANDVINNSQLKCYPQHFANRVNSVVQYCYNLFMNTNSGEHTDEEVNDLLINLMNTLVYYKNSYNPNGYGYKVMNSLLDIIKETFIKIN